MSPSRPRCSIACGAASSSATTTRSMQEGFGYVKQLKHEETLKDLSAAIAVVKHAGRVGVVGYCWGGTHGLCRRRASCPSPAPSPTTAAASCRYLDKKPKCPVMYHFGERDKHITPADVAKIKAAHPEGIYHLYPARTTASTATSAAATSAESAALARKRTLEFFARLRSGRNQRMSTNEPETQRPQAPAHPVLHRRQVGRCRLRRHGRRQQSRHGREARHGAAAWAPPKRAAPSKPRRERIARLGGEDREGARRRSCAAGTTSCSRTRTTSPRS